MKHSNEIIGDAVRKYWNDFGIPIEVVVFFKQKYNHEEEYGDDWVIASPISSDDYETVEFNTDFCEGQTDVKDIKIFTLSYVVNEFWYSLTERNY